MKKFLSIFLALSLLLPAFPCLAFATTTSWQASYFNKLIEIREKPGIIQTVLTDKDYNGFYTETICYALNDYNRDSIPELVVYGTNIANEAGDNYQVYTYNNGKIKKFRIISHEGPYGENVSFSEQPYWPYHTNFFFLPDGYTDKKTNDLVWVMKTEPNYYEYWAIAGTPYENESIFEVSFNFKNMTADIVPIIFAERTEPNEYCSKLKSWKDNHELSIHHDEYGRKIPDNNELLWKQLSELFESSYFQSTTSDALMPQIEIKNKFLILYNKAIKNAVFWAVGSVTLVMALLLVKIMIRKIKK